MDFAYTAEDEAFRDELKAWLDEKLPKFLAEWSEGDDEDASRWAARERMRVPVHSTTPKRMSAPTAC